MILDVAERRQQLLSLQGASSSLRPPRADSKHARLLQRRLGVVGPQGTRLQDLYRFLHYP